MSNPYAKKKIIWVNLVFFTITTLCGLIGGAIYLQRYGISKAELLLTAFYVVATGLGITVGYHRLFAHATFKAHPVVRFLMLFFGAAAFEQPALSWASQHRDHHRFVDTDRDPYSIKKGFFYAHIGWLVFWKHVLNYDNAKDLQKDALVMHQYRHYALWAVGAGILTPLIIGALTGHLLGAFLLAVCARLTLVYHATFCINSICHMVGTSTYDIHASAKDHWLVALVTFGEGYHNFHHRFPSDYRNGVRWYHWDPSKWLIAILSGVGLARDLRRVSDFRILDARLAAQQQRAGEKLCLALKIPAVSKSVEKLKTKYAHLRSCLMTWEAASSRYQNLLRDRINGSAQEIRRNALWNVYRARRRFEIEHEKWTRFLQVDLTAGISC